MISELENKLKKEDINVLRKDICYIIKLAEMIDRMYAKDKAETYHYLKKLRCIIDRFNEKYPNVHAVVDKNYLRICVSFFLKKASVNDIFSQISRDDFKKKIFGNSIELDMPNVIEKTYSNDTLNSLVLKRCPHRNMVELIYRQDTLYNTLSPEFKILAEHALLPEYRKDFHIRIAKDDVFCFDFDEDNEDRGLVYAKKPDSAEISY